MLPLVPDKSSQKRWRGSRLPMSQHLPGFLLAEDTTLRSLLIGRAVASARAATAFNFASK
jgi:hypothetical protein